MNPTNPTNPTNLEDYILLEIFEALGALGEALPAHHMEDIDGFLLSIEPLTDAVKRERWDLIVKATKMQAEKRLTEVVKGPGGEITVTIHQAEEHAKILARHIARKIWRHPEKFGLPDGRPTKAEILDVLETKYPGLHEKLPTSPRGLTNWWKAVGCGAEQRRGYGRQPPRDP